MWKEYNRIFIFMLPKPKIWKIRVYVPISEIFWDLILPWWIIRISFYKIVCHIIFRKIFAYLNVSNSGLFFFPFCNRSSRKIILFSFFCKGSSQRNTMFILFFFLVTVKPKELLKFQTDRTSMRMKKVTAKELHIYNVNEPRDGITVCREW